MPGPDFHPLTLILIGTPPCRLEYIFCPPIWKVDIAKKIRLPNRPCFNSKFIPGNDWSHQLFFRCGVKTVLVRPALKVLQICIFMKILSRKTRPALGPTGPQTCSPAALKAHCARPGLIYRQIYVQPGLISPNYHCGREVSKYILLGEFHRHSFIKST